MTGQTTAGAHTAGTLTAADRITPDAASPRALRACAAAAGPLFVIAALVQALTRPGFNLTRNALSLLDDGSLGWIQAANFIVAARRYRACGQRTTAACSVAAGVLCAAGVATGGTPHGSLTLFTGVSIALLWAAFTTTRLITIRSLPWTP
jgi:hypothetical protein